MSTILDHPEIHSRLVRWSVDEYEQMAEQGMVPKRAELIRGLVVNKMPKSPLHCALAKRLYDAILQALPPGFLVYQERPLRLADSEPEPDIAVIRGDEGKLGERHPTTAALVVEVAVSNPLLDRANASLYAEAGVQEYWIVLGRERRVEVFTQPLDGAYTAQRLVTSEQSLNSVAIPEIVLPLGELFK